MKHKTSCQAYGNYQPPYEDCTCGAEDEAALTLNEEELNTLWDLIKNQWIPHNIDAVKLITKISVAVNRGEKK